MTDRHGGYIIALDRNIRSDDAEGILNAIRMIKGVSGVTPVISDTAAEQVAEMRCHAAWRGALVKLLREGPGRE